MEALEGDRLADPQAGRRQELEEQPVTLRRALYDGRQLIGGEDLGLVAVGLLARRQRQSLRRVVADQALALRSRQCRPQRNRGVGDRAVSENLALRLLVGQPVNEAGKGVGGDVDQLEAGGEVAVGVGADQAPVFLAGELAEAPAALAAVAPDPLVQVAAEGDRASLLQLAAVAVGLTLALDPLRLLIGAVWRFRCLAPLR